MKIPKYKNSNKLNEVSTATALTDFPEYGVKKGDSYFWWFDQETQQVLRTLETPSRSQVALDGWLSSLIDLVDGVPVLTYLQVDDYVHTLEGYLSSLQIEREEMLERCPQPLEYLKIFELIQDKRDQYKAEIQRLIKARHDLLKISSGAFDEYSDIKGAIDGILDRMLG